METFNAFAQPDAQPEPETPKDAIEETLEKEVLDREAIYKIIQDAPTLSSPDEKEAPFANFAENTHNSWNNVDAGEVEEYLKDKLYFDTGDIPSAAMKQIGDMHLRADEELIKIPLDLVVSAAGFKNWKGRREGVTKQWGVKNGRDNIGGEMSSLNVIKMYAGTPTDLPPVGIMAMYIQPNKKVFFGNVGGDSHRIAAAILRGDKNIEAERLFVYKLDTNYL